MKKHIIGLALFSIIVGMAAFIYAVFNVVNVEEVFTPAYTPNYQGTSCWKMNRDLKESKLSSPLIRQATVSAESGLFIFEIGCVENLKQVNLYFYEKNEGNTNLLAIEKIDLKSSVNCKNNSSLYKNFAWAKEVNRASNIYVIARASNQENISSTNFEESLATPVLIADRGSRISF
jgi:hypothetical protein